MLLRLHVAALAFALSWGAQALAQNKVRTETIRPPATKPDDVEVLAILVTILQSGFVHADKGTAQEMYLWPYFARMPVKALSAEQRVELFRIITGKDYKDMMDFGAYIFYRLGIGPDGSWRY